MDLSLFKVKIGNHAFKRYLQRYVGKNLSKEELEARLNRSEASSVLGFGENVLLIDGVYWCCYLLDEVLLLTTCLGNYDLQYYHMWERKQLIKRQQKWIRFA
ncbi:hypothetical protein [Paenibacillus koleovorans]|uniref:hypothetical protein n=1 Tax=Paenibacillus koleovorans TaxID=121608 RepID=UPI0013E37FA3|nr:hypothetical protein [Paenibacillus koleovorans]